MGFFSTLWGSTQLLWGRVSGYARNAYFGRVVPELRTLRGALIVEVLVFLGCIVPLAFISTMSTKLVVFELGAVALTLTLLWLSLKHLVSGVIAGTAVAGTTRAVGSVGGALALPLYGIYEYARIVAAILASELTVGLIALWLPLHNNPLVSLLGLVVGTILAAYAIWMQGVLGWPKIVWFTAMTTLVIALVAILAPDASKALADKIAQSDALIRLVTGAEMSAGALLFLSIAMLIAVFAMLTLGSGLVKMLGLAVFLLYLPLVTQAVLVGWPELNVVTDEWRRQKKVASVRKIDSTMPTSELAQRLVAALKASGTMASERAVKKIGGIEKKARDANRPLTPSEITKLFEEYKLGADIEQGVDQHIEQFRKDNPGLFLQEKRKEKPTTKEAPKQTPAPAPQQSRSPEQGGEWVGSGQVVYVARRELEWGKQRKVFIPPFGYRFETSFESKEQCGLEALVNDSIIVPNAHTELNMNKFVPHDGDVRSIRYRPTDCAMVILRVKVESIMSNPILSQ